MRHAILLCLSVALLTMGCQDEPTPLPTNISEMIQGDWTMTKTKAKTWLGKVRVGGETQKLNIEVVLRVDSSRYTFLDDFGNTQQSGPYELPNDSITFFNELDSTERPECFFIQKLTDSEMELFTTQDSTTRLGETYSEVVYYYER